jgi:cytochrome b561
MLPLRNTAAQWGWVSIALHWLTVLAIIGLGIVGTQMDDLPTGMAKVKVYALHKSVGLTVLGLTVVRLAWRWFAGAPALVAMPRWQRIAAHFSHVALYALLLAMPVSGWLLHSASSSAGYALRWFGWFKVPALVAYDPAIKALAHDVHEALFKLILLVAFVHVAAALKHHFANRDPTLHRMLPLVRSPSPKGIEPP